MATPTTTPAATATPTKPSKMRQALNWVGFAVIPIIILLTVLFSTLRTEDNVGQAAGTQTASATQPTSGIITAVPNQWQGAISLDGTKQFGYTILVDDVYWLVRYDHDDNRIVKMYPRNYAPGSSLHISNACNVVEFSIVAGQRAEQAPIAWSLTNRKGT